MRTNKLSADNILSKLRGVFDFAQVKMAESQQEQEKQINWYKKKTLKFIKGDKVWLKLKKQFLTGRDSKKFD